MILRLLQLSRAQKYTRRRQRRNRRVWPAMLIAAPLAATSLYGGEPPLETSRLPAISAAAKPSITRGYVPLERWQASQAALHPEQFAAPQPQRPPSSGPGETRSSPAPRPEAGKASPPTLTQSYLPLQRWQSAQAGVQNQHPPTRPTPPEKQVVYTAGVPTLAPASGNQESSPQPHLAASNRPVIISASHRMREASELQAPSNSRDVEAPEDDASAAPRLPDGRTPGSRTRAETVDAPSALSEPMEVYEIDLPTTLRLMVSANPTMAVGREEVREMLALQTRARTMMLPSLNAGTAFHKHEGNFQASTGQIKDIYSQSLYFGGGTRVWAAESLAIPMIRIIGHVGDAIYEPLVVRQEVTNKRFNSSATSNTLLLSAIVRYFELLSAEGRYEAARQTEREAAEIVRITASYALTGEGREGDANRARTEAYLMHVEVQSAEERIALASARLAELLSLDPTTRLRTIGGPIGGVDLIDQSLDLDTLIRRAERRRPELAAASATVAANSTRLRQEQTRPLFPMVMLGFSAGSFGGGSVLFPPKIGNFGGRNDFDALAVWSLNNLGVGNMATVAERRAVLNQSIAERTRALNGVRQEVIAAYGLMQGERLQIRITQRQLKDSEQAFREEFQRLRGAEALPIEVLNIVDQLGVARQEVIKAITAYNQAQFRLFVATGVSPGQIVRDGSDQGQSAASAAPRNSP